MKIQHQFFWSVVEIGIRGKSVMLNVYCKEIDRQSSEHQLRKKKNKVNLKGDDKNK